MSSLESDLPYHNSDSDPIFLLQQSKKVNEFFLLCPSKKNLMKIGGLIEIKYSS